MIKKIALVLEPVNKGEVKGSCLECKHFTASFEDSISVYGECYFDRKKLFRTIPEYGCKFFEPRQ